MLVVRVHHDGICSIHTVLLKEFALGSLPKHQVAAPWPHVTIVLIVLVNSHLVSILQPISRMRNSASFGHLG